MGFLFVALGGALGAVLRYTISLIPYKGSFPVLTLVTNVLGALLIGFIVGFIGDKQGNALLFWKTGVCGGFTTFSTFSLEAFTLFESRKYVLGGSYVVLSCALCLLGIFCGQKISTLVKG